MHLYLTILSHYLADPATPDSMLEMSNINEHIKRVVTTRAKRLPMSTICLQLKHLKEWYWKQIS